MHVVDPDNASATLFSSAIDFGGVPLSTVALTLDAGTRSYTRRGVPLAFFVRDRQLFRLGLSKPGTPEAVRVSSQTNVCGLLRVFQLDGIGLDAWLWINTGGADGDCNTVLDNVPALVRSGAGDGTPATLLPANVTPLGTLGDASGRLLWMLAHDRSTAGAFKLVAYDTSLTRTEVAGGAGISTAGVVNLTVPGSHAVLADGVYMRADAQLRRLSGDASALTLAPSSYAFNASVGMGMADGANFYFPDGNKLVRVSGTAPPAVVATLPAGNGDITSLTQTPTRVLTLQLTGLTNTTSAIGKLDGSVRQLLSGDRQSTPSSSLRTPLAVLGEALYYTTGSDTKLGDVRKVQTDGTGDALVLSGAYSAGAVLRTAGRVDYSQLFYGAAVSLVTCVPAAGAADCRTGSLRQFDLASGASTVLGSFTTNAAPAWTVSALGWDGLPGMEVTASGIYTVNQPYDRRDMWLANPGVAGSLRRVTTTMP